MFWKRKSADSRRDNSWQVAKSLGYPTNPLLPPIESDLRLRLLPDILNRVLVLNVVCAHSYGFPQDKARQWLQSEDLEHALSPAERAFLFDSRGDKTIFQSQVEAIWSFLWCLGIIPSLKFDERCSDNLVRMVPDLKNMKPSLDFKAKVSLRSQDEVITMLDLVYCLHWGQRQFHLDGGKWNYPPAIIEERRRAIEWSLSNVDWDDITLDT